MSDIPTTVGECLVQFDDHELAQWLRTLDDIIAHGRRRDELAATNAWYMAVRDAGEQEQRRRRGKDADEATALRRLYAAAQGVPADDRQQLMRGYETLFSGAGPVSGDHPLAMLSAILYIILDVAEAPPTVA